MLWVHRGVGLIASVTELKSAGPSNLVSQPGRMFLEMTFDPPSPQKPSPTRSEMHPVCGSRKSGHSALVSGAGKNYP